MQFKKFSDIKLKKLNEEQEYELTSTSSNPIEGIQSQSENTPKEEVSNKDENKVTQSDPSKFFSKIFEARQMAHIYHLQVNGDTGSYAAHTALNDYYDDLLDLLDELVEVYQGQYSIIENYELIDTKDTKSKEKIEYFTEFVNFIKDTRKMAILEEDTHLHNIIDEIVALTYKLLYKLKYNK